MALEQQQPQKRPHTFQQVLGRATQDQARMHGKLMALHAGIVAAVLPLVPKDAVQLSLDYNSEC